MTCQHIQISRGIHVHTQMKTNTLKRLASHSLGVYTCSVENQIDHTDSSVSKYYTWVWTFDRASLDVWIFLWFRLEGPGSASLYRIPRRLSQKDRIREDLMHDRQRSVSLDWWVGSDRGSYPKIYIYTRIRMSLADRTNSFHVWLVSVASCRYKFYIQEVLLETLYIYIKRILVVAH